MALSIFCGPSRRFEYPYTKKYPYYLNFPFVQASDYFNGVLSDSWKEKVWFRLMDDLLRQQTILLSEFKKLCSETKNMNYLS